MKQMIQRFFALMLVLSIMIVPVSVTASAESAIIYRDDYESYTVGVGGDGQAGLTTLDGNVREADGNKYIEMTEEGAMMIKNFGVPISSGKLLIKSDIYVADNNEVRVVLLKGSEGNEEHALRLRILNNTLVFTYYDGTRRTERSCGSIPSGEWVNIAVEIDMDNIKFEQFYVNGTPTLPDDAQFYFYNHTITYVDNILFYNLMGNSSFRVDNVSVRYNWYPEVTSAIDHATELMGTVNKGTEPGKYPESSFTVLKEAIAEVEKASSVSGLSAERQQELIAILEVAEEQFLQSMIGGEPASLYELRFDGIGDEVGDEIISNGLDGAVSGEIVLDGTKQVGKITAGYLDLLQDVVLPDKFTVSMKAKIASGNWRLLHISEPSGNHCAFTIESLGSNLAYWRNRTGTNKAAFLNGHSRTEYYTISADVDWTNAQYTLSYAVGDGDPVTVATYDFPEDSEPGSISRIAHFNPYDANQELYIEYYKVIPKMDLPTLSNTANSVTITGEDIIENGQSVAYSATVYDREYNPWSDQSVTWTVLEGDADITGDVLTPDPDFAGIVRLKAAYSENVFEIKEVLCLPAAVVANAKVTLDENKMIVTGQYELGKYIPREMDVTLSANGGFSSVSDTVSVDPANGNFKAEFTLPAATATQVFTATIDDSEFGTCPTATASLKFYGEDASMEMVHEINTAKNNNQDTASILAEYRDIVGLTLNFAFDTHSADYHAKILDTTDDFVDQEDLQSYLDELNFMFGVRYGSRETIESVVSKGIGIMEENGLTELYSSLEEGTFETFYINIIGLTSETIPGLVALINEKIEDIVSNIEEDSDDEEKDIPNRTGNGGGGGVSNVKPSDEVVTVTPEPEKLVFKDVFPGHWAYDAIMKLNEKGVMIGSDGYAYPDNRVTRAEFAKLLCKAFDITNIENIPVFNDYSNDSWWAESVAAIVSAGIVKGYEDNTFRPNATITREEAAVMLARCIEYCNMKVYNKEEEGEFSDSSSVADYAKEAVSKLRLYKVVSGKENNIFAPKDSVTRAESAAMIVNLMSFSETDGNINE